jgi:hypothetical protein
VLCYAALRCLRCAVLVPVACYLLRLMLLVVVTVTVAVAEVAVVAFTVVVAVVLCCFWAVWTVLC